MGRDVYEIKLRIITYSIILCSCTQVMLITAMNIMTMAVTMTVFICLTVLLPVLVWQSKLSHVPMTRNRMMRGTIWKVTATSIQQAINLLRRGLRQPGIAIETGDNITIYKPYIRVQYNINDNWWTAFRYRQEYMRRNTEGKDDRMVYRPEARVGYNINNWMFELNGIYKIADSEDLYNNKSEDYEYHFRVAYNIGSRVPFVEIGNVSSGYNTTTTDDRQTRYRVGLGYNF